MVGKKKGGGSKCNGVTGDHKPPFCAKKNDQR
jgi:hypothetical protein